jgi:DNA-binding protein YbaB
MAGMKDQMALVMKLKKAQKELSKEIVEVEAGDGAVVLQINGELKITSLQFDEEIIQANSISYDQLADYCKAAFRDGLKAAQEVAAEKMKPLMGSLGNLGM